MVATVQQRDWILQRTPDRQLTVELPEYEGLPAEYFGTKGWAPDHTASLGAVQFRACILGSWNIKRRISGRLLGGGQTQIASGNITLSDAKLSSQLSRAERQRWEGRPMILRYGNPRWLNPDDHIKYVGQVGRIERNNLSITIVFNDARAKLDVQFPIDRYAANDGPGALDLAGAIGTIKPWTGGKVFNANTVVLDPSIELYGATGNGGTVKEARDAGTDLDVGVDWVAVSGGNIDLDNALPQRLITVDVDGPTAPDFTAPTVLTNLLLSVTDDTGTPLLSAGDLDQPAIDNMTSGQPRDIGLWLGDQNSLIRSLDAICDSVGAAWFGTRDGKISVIDIDLPTGNPVWAIDEHQIIGGVRISKATDPVDSLVIGIRVSWADQGIEGIDAAVPLADKVAYSTRTQAAVVSFDQIVGSIDKEADQQGPDSIEPIPTLLVDKGQAIAESQQWSRILSDSRNRIVVTSAQGAGLLELGDELRIRHIDISALAALRDHDGHVLVDHNHLPLQDAIDVLIDGLDETIPIGQVTITGWY